MKRIRIIGLTLVAVLAASAVAAASASASKFEAETYTVTVKAKGTNTQIFKVDSGTSECTTSSFEGKATAASETLKVLPVYSGCSFIPVGKSLETAEVKMNGCEFEFHAIKEISANHFEGSVDVISSPGHSCATEPITVKAAVCEVKVGPQTGLKSIEYVNVNSASWKTPPHPPWGEVEVNANVSGITYEESLTCPSRTLPQPKANGTYTGKALAKGFNTLAAQEGIRVF